MPQQDCHLRHPRSYQHQRGCQPKGCPYASARHDKRIETDVLPWGLGSWLMGGGQISWCPWGAESPSPQRLSSSSHSATSSFLTLHPQLTHILRVLDSCKGFSRLYSSQSPCELLLSVSKHSLVIFCVFQITEKNEGKK